MAIYLPRTRKLIYSWEPGVPAESTGTDAFSSAQLEVMSGAMKASEVLLTLTESVANVSVSVPESGAIFLETLDGALVDVDIIDGVWQSAAVTVATGSIGYVDVPRLRTLRAVKTVAVNDAWPLGAMGVYSRSSATHGAITSRSCQTLSGGVYVSGHGRQGTSWSGAFGMTSRADVGSILQNMKVRGLTFANRSMRDMASSWHVWQLGTIVRKVAGASCGRTQPPQNVVTTFDGAGQIGMTPASWVHSVGHGAGAMSLTRGNEFVLRVTAPIGTQIIIRRKKM